MGDIISFTNYRRQHIGEERGESMYTELINELQNNPATNYNISEVERLADRVLSIDGHEAGATPIVKIANDFNFKTFSMINMPEEISGNIFVNGTTKDVYGNDRVIMVNKEEEYAHQRFIIAHELGHYLLDYIGSEESMNPGKLFSKAYPKSNHDSVEEIRADRFAAELLMPKNLFRRQYIKAMKRSNNNLRYTIEYLANYFKTKKSSIERRIDEAIIE